MTTKTNPTPAAEAIRKACHWGVLTPTALERAAAVLDGLWAVGATHGLEADDLDLAGQVIIGLEKVNRRREPEDIDLAALVLHAAHAAAHELGLAPDDLVTEHQAHSAVCAWTVLRRQPQTPAWGPRGTADLIVRLWREDEGRGRFGPWEWSLFPDVGTSLPQVIAPPPTLEVAEEVGQIAARALAGQQPYPRS